MIVPMKKLSLLVFYKDYQSFLDELRDKGVVHIHENKKRSAEDEHLKLKMAIVKRIGEILRLLARRQPGPKQLDELVRLWKKEGNNAGKEKIWEQLMSPVKSGSTDVQAEGLELLAFLEEEYKRLEQIGQQIAVCRKDASLFGPWGEFSRERMEGLSRAGWDMRFFTAPDKKYLPEWEEKYNAFLINQEKGQKYFVTLVPSGETANPDADVFVFPQSNAEELEAQIQQLEQESGQITQELNALSALAMERLSYFRQHLNEDTDELKVTGASHCLMEDKVIALEGWIPAEIAPDTDKWLEDKGIYYAISEPAMEDNPPIKLKNNRFAKLFEFIGELYSLPSYREIDLTPFFAPFFLLFFGLCLGDSGYGLFILLAVSIYKLKAKPGIKPILSLAQWLGFGTMILGFVSGTFFGIPLAEVAWLERFKVIMLDSKQLFNLALIIGVVQIIFGMFIKVANLWRQFGWPAALSTIGWLVMILGEGTCYVLMMKGYDVKIPMYIIGGSAGLLIFLFNNLKRNIFINIGAGTWDTYNMITGLMGDTLSYIRLFALGISGSVLGLVFNNLALNMSGDIPVVSQLIMLVILLFGHGVNIFIASLGAFVHPMRLTFVEFYKNSGFEGGGKKYQPFKRRVTVSGE